MSRMNEPPTTGGTDYHDRRSHIERICDMDPFPAQVTRCPTHKQLFGGQDASATGLESDA